MDCSLCNCVYLNSVCKVAASLGRCQSAHTAAALTLFLQCCEPYMGPAGVSMDELSALPLISLMALGAPDCFKVTVTLCGTAAGCHLLLRACVRLQLDHKGKLCYSLRWIKRKTPFHLLLHGAWLCAVAALLSLVPVFVQVSLNATGCTSWVVVNRQPRLRKVLVKDFPKCFSGPTGNSCLLVQHKCTDDRTVVGLNTELITGSSTPRQLGAVGAAADFMLCCRVQGSAADLKAAARWAAPATAAPHCSSKGRGPVYSYISIYTSFIIMYTYRSTWELFPFKLKQFISSCKWCSSRSCNKFILIFQLIRSAKPPSSEICWPMDWFIKLY